MKYYAVLLCLLLSYVLHADNNKGYLQVSRYDSRDESGIMMFNDTMTLFRMPDNVLTASKQFPSWGSIDIDALPQGQYLLRYHNIYGEECKRSIRIEKDDTVKVSLYLDSLITYRPLSVAVLKEGESIVLNCFSSGCFHSWGERLMITRKGQDFVAVLYQLPFKLKLENGGWHPKVKVRAKRRGRVKLRAKQLDAFTRFENELTVIAEGGACTTTTWYSLQTPSYMVNKMDGCCAWDGYTSLRQTLFGNERPDDSH